MAKLLLYWHKLSNSAAYIGSIWGVGPKEQKHIKSLDDCAKVIGKNTSLDELVIYCHGFHGGFMLNKGYNLSEPAVRDAFIGLKAKIKVIRFEGCWIGESPDELQSFGTYFDANQVSGFTWAHWENTITIPLIKKGTTVEVMRKNNDLKHLENWLSPIAPTFSQLSIMAQNGDVKNKVIPLEWFEYTTGMAPPYKIEKENRQSNFERFGTHKYKKRSDANQRNLTVSDLESSSSSSINPVPSFDYVTVKLK